MKSEFFQDFGIPVAECKIEPRIDQDGVPRLWFKSAGNPDRSLDIAEARQLQLMLLYARELRHADEIARHIATAEQQRRLLRLGLKITLVKLERRRRHHPHWRIPLRATGISPMTTDARFPSRPVG